ncbi:hypothetical protein K6T82_16645 [Flavobacterium sp. 17A]|uniref:Lipoprotein n=1 Tax=Flavobacterium potami TaxID=2872310 RepID=A0A9X1HDK9_9FLAO|nr:hypothetical protein [Flavobacterium potami]MBZ4036402.1 hypothetical protein [Flavobacterium potami]
MKKYFSLFLIILLISCSEKNPIEKSLETKSDEYWCYYTNCNSYFTYFKFKDDQLSYRYNKDENGKFTTKPEDPFMPEDPQKWSVSEDSIMTWGNFSYDVVSYNDKAIVLVYPTKEKPYLNYLFLIKEKESDFKKYSDDYNEKRLYNPEKYKTHK